MSTDIDVTKQLLETIAALESRVISAVKSAETAAKRQRTAQANLAKEVGKLRAHCAPAFAAAIEQYNKTHQPQIQAARSELAFLAKTQSLGVYLRLCYPGGEPDEEFNQDDVERIRATFATFLEPELQKIGMTFPLKHVSVPIVYFSV